ncbi:MAG: hypothetical protein P8Q92_04665 [Pseudoprimorskyibacter sp.]|nr:hypothetical protein [Pseudoprimorskyibacter sp.]
MAWISSVLHCTSVRALFGVRVSLKIAYGSITALHRHGAFWIFACRLMQVCPTLNLLGVSGLTGPVTRAAAVSLCLFSNQALSVVPALEIAVGFVHFSVSVRAQTKGFNDASGRVDPVRRL